VILRKRVVSRLFGVADVTFVKHGIIYSRKPNGKIIDGNNLSLMTERTIFARVDAHVGSMIYASSFVNLKLKRPVRG